MRRPKLSFTGILSGAIRRGKVDGCAGPELINAGFGGQVEEKRREHGSEKGVCVW